MKFAMESSIDTNQFTFVPGSVFEWQCDSKSLNMKGYGDMGSLKDMVKICLKKSYNSLEWKF